MPRYEQLSQFINEKSELNLNKLKNKEKSEFSAVSQANQKKTFFRIKINLSKTFDQNCNFWINRADLRAELYHRLYTNSHDKRP